MSRELTYEQRCAIYEVASELRSAEHQMILALRTIYTTVAAGSLRIVRADIANILEKLDAADALINPPPAAERSPTNVVNIEDVATVGILMR